METFLALDNSCNTILSNCYTNVIESLNLKCLTPHKYYLFEKIN